MADASNATPDASKAPEKAVKPLPARRSSGSRVGAAAAMPAKAPAEQTNLDHGPAETENQLAAADVTQEQLAKSNEPEFTGALEAKKEGEAHSQQAPAAFRESEAAKLQAAQTSAQAAGAQPARHHGRRQGAVPAEGRGHSRPRPSPQTRPSEPRSRPHQGYLRQDEGRRRRDPGRSRRPGGKEVRRG